MNTVLNSLPLPASTAPEFALVRSPDPFNALRELRAPEPEAIAKLARAALAEAHDLKPIESDFDYEIVAEACQSIKLAYKETEEWRKRLTAPLTSASKDINDRFRLVLSLLLEKETETKLLMQAYHEEQERARKEAIRKAEAEARAELARAQAQAEALRAQATAQEAAALAAAGDDPQARARAQHEAAEAFADAELMAEQAEFMPVAAPLMQAVSRPSGVSMRYQHEPVVVDELALFRHVVAHPEFMSLVSVNMPALRGLAKSLGDALNLPGVHITKKAITSVKSK